MRRLHLLAGITTVVVFVLTGQVLRHHAPPMGTLDGASRLLYRSRHIYILSAGLVNLMLGVYLLPRSGWRRRVQIAGSVLLIASPVALTAAFLVEPGRGFQPEMPWSSLGLYALFGGSMLHALSAARRS